MENKTYDEALDAKAEAWEVAEEVSPFGKHGEREE